MNLPRSKFIHATLASVLILASVAPGALAQSLEVPTLEGKGVAELHLLRNELFARHGYKFKNAYLTEIFSLRGTSVTHHMPMTAGAKASVETLKKAEAAAWAKARESARELALGHSGPFVLGTGPLEKQEGKEGCFKADLTPSRELEVVCTYLAPAAEFHIAIIGIDGSFLGLPAMFIPDALRPVDANPSDGYRELSITGSDSQGPRAYLVGIRSKQAQIISRQRARAFTTDNH